MSAKPLAILALVLFGLIGAHHEKAPSGVPAAANYVRVYTGDDGESHFERLKAPLTLDSASAQSLSRSGEFATGPFSLIGAPTDWAYTWHTAPRRQFVIVLQGTMEVEVHSGAKETFAAGSVLLADDLSGRGHLTRSVGPDPLILGVMALEASP